MEGTQRIIISGDWETLDRETIKNRFTSGRLRDGLAFIAWVNSFHDYKSEDGQIALNAEFKRIMVVKPDGAGGNLASMRKRWLDGFSVWKKLDGNVEGDLLFDNGSTRLRSTSSCTCTSTRCP